MRFREARGVVIPKEYCIQLCTHDHQQLKRHMDQFVHKAHFGIFLFLKKALKSVDDNGLRTGRSGSVSSGGCSSTGSSDNAVRKEGGRIMPRAFRLNKEFELQEETDPQKILDAWNDFKCSCVMQSCTELDDDILKWSRDRDRHLSSLGENEKRALHKARQDLNRNASLNVHSILSHYLSEQSNEEERLVWGPTHSGENTSHPAIER